MPEDEKEGQEEQEEQGLSPEEREQILGDFEAKVESGDFGGRPFHNVVRQQLYPLLGEEQLSEEEFSRLVRMWAVSNYPFDWPKRSYQEEA